LSIALALVLPELAVQVLVRTGALATPRPSRPDLSFWDPDHEPFGVWHRPDSTGFHKTECFDVTYRTNSVGARDVERSLDATRSRVVVLGDSFVEGWGLPPRQRLTNLLEQASGLEHLNFGMSHFGPYQQYLVYRDLAKRYTHDHVLIGIVPVNDFIDLDLEQARQAPTYEYRYRPYLVGSYPDYRRFDFRESTVQRFLRRHSYAYTAIEHAFHGRGGADSRKDLTDESGRFHSLFYDFSEEQFDLLRYALERIIDEAEGKRVAVFLIPVHQDFLRFYQSGESPLVRRLRELGASRGLGVVDLLPAMSRVTPNWNTYYFECDYHWGPYGNAVAAGLLAGALEGDYYGRREP